MKILIIGGGSIGQRHLRNLKDIGIENISILDVDKKRLPVLEEKYRVKTHKNLGNALKEKWNAIFICTPPSSHIEIALKATATRTPLFIEKPLSDNLKNIPKLIAKIKKNKIPVMIGYNLNFHPHFQEIKKILKEKILGQIWGVKAEYGSYLPDWHPWEDYRKGYSAQKRLGGGIILDDIHEIDYLYSLFGKVKKIFTWAGKLSDLEINTEDYAEIILLFENGVVGQIHMDYLQRMPSRNLKIIGEKGTLSWDIRKSELSYFLVKDKKWQIHRIKDFDYNQTYLNEIRHFFDCLKKKKHFVTDINRGYQTLKIALAAKKSAKFQKIIKI